LADRARGFFLTGIAFLLSGQAYGKDGPRSTFFKRARRRAVVRSVKDLSIDRAARVLVLLASMEARDSGTYRWIVAVSSVLTVTAALGFARFGYSMILPGMKAGFGLTEAQAGDLATANMIGYLVFSLIGGMLASRWGPRVVISISLAGVAAGMALTGLAPSYGAAFAARLFTGMASGGANVPVMGLLSAWFDSRRRGLAGGMAVGGSSIGLLVTGIAVPAILDRFGALGWRASWLCLAGAAVIIAAVCAAAIRNSPADQGKVPRRHGGGRPAGNASADGTRISDVFSNPKVWFLGFIYVFFGFAYIVYATFFVRYLTAEAGLGMNEAGAFWSLIGGLSIASGFIWGSVSDRLGRKHGLALVYFLQGLSFLAFGIWKAPAGFLVSGALFALTAWSIPAIMAAAAGDLLGPRLAPGALGFLTVFLGIGQVTGPFVAGRIAQATGTYAGAFVLAGALALAGAVLSLFLRLAPRRSAGSRPVRVGSIHPDAPTPPTVVK
jgi:predicted MFS family arabinose efflux permease